MGVGQSLGLPPGSGPHQVGCTDVMADHTREGSFFRLYYPCKPEEGVEEHPPWIPKYEYVVGMADYMSLNKRWCVPLLNLAFGSLRVPVSWNAPVIPGRRFPLIIFSHGLGAFRGTVHKNHTDFAFLKGALLSRFVETRGRLEAEKALEITTRAALAFLHRHLDLEADFDQWDALVEGKGDDDVIPNAPSCLSSL